MKKNLTIVFALGFFTILLLNSCKKVTEFLDAPPGADYDENTVFSAMIETEKYVVNLYQYGMPSPFPIRIAENNLDAGVTSNTSFIGVTDEGEASETFASTQDWNTASVTPVTITSREDLRYFLRWRAIRIANILLERVDEVPDASLGYKNQVKGEALFIRAINNFEMLKRYGGFPIVNKRIVSFEESKIPRSNFEECVNTIIKDCDDAVTLLPKFDQLSNFKGRVQRGAALALKARTLLYAASPLFNTATPPSSFGNATDDKLICYGNYDVNRWKLAADAADSAKTWCDDNGYGLIDGNVDSLKKPIVRVGRPVEGYYRTAWEVNDNKECILGNKIWTGAKGISAFPWQFFLPRSNYVPNAGGFWTAPSISLNFVRKYEKRNGTPQVWDAAGGNDLLQKYNDLDPRFCQTVCYVGSRLHNAVTSIQIGQGTPSDKSACKGGAWMLKFLPDALNVSQIPHAPIFRYNELLLNYAEALNESGQSSAALIPLNRIRQRSGMDSIKTTDKDLLRIRIRNERDIELAFEDHRLNDIRRWVVAEDQVTANGITYGVMQGNMVGIEINQISAAPGSYNYKPFVFEQRTFLKRMYLFPFDNTEVLKGNLKQNPGW